MGSRCTITSDSIKRLQYVSVSEMGGRMEIPLPASRPNYKCRTTILSVAVNETQKRSTIFGDLEN